MRRRDFLKILTPVVSLGLFSKAKFAWGQEEEFLKDLRIWAYYVPLTSYNKILETFEGKHPLDQKVIFDEVKKVTNRISGKETDGTKNPDSFEVEELENAQEYLRIHFWHDDNRRAGHTLHVFPRYLEELKLGKSVLVATGMFQSHFHVVLIQPPT